MSGLKKVVIRFLCITMLLVGMQTSIVGATEVMPRYVGDIRVTTVLKLSSNAADCGVKIFGKSGTTRIGGTVRLYDDTTKLYVGSWNVNQASATYIGSYSAAVKSGHQYTLSFMGTVYDANGVGETVSSSTTKHN